MSSNKQDFVSVMIVTYNSQSHITDCLTSLYKFEKKFIKEVIIIDNSSTDSTIKSIKDLKLNNLRIIELKQNTGFSKAVNIGIKVSTGKLILLLNPDTKVIKECIYKLIQSINKPFVGVVGGKMIGRDNYIHKTHVRFPDLMTGIFDFSNIYKIFPNNRWHNKFYYLDKDEKNLPSEVNAVSGGFMMMKREVIEEVGYLNESFFMYLEDIDYCYRVNKSGFKVIFCPESIIFHEGGGSSHNKDKINFEAWIDSRRKYYLCNFPMHKNIIIQPIFYLDELFMRIWRIIK